MNAGEVEVIGNTKLYQDISEDQSNQFNDEYCEVLADRLIISPTKDCSNISGYMECSEVADVGALGCESLQNSGFSR